MMRILYVPMLLALLLCSAAFGAEISKVKGSNALINLSGMAAAPGDQFFVMSADGKKRAILQITKVKGDKAIGAILKGKADTGMTLEPKAAGAPVASRKKKGGSSGGGSSSNSRVFWGGMVGYARDSMNVQVNRFSDGQPLQTTALTGSAFSAMGLFDYELFPQIWFRGLGGLEGFNVSGSNLCGTANRETCNASIYYISMDFIGRYIFATGDMRPWVGGGIALMFPASKSATALQSSSISNTSVIQIMGGLDWFISPTMFVPISIEYGLLPKSNEVDATWMEFRIGLGFPL